MAKDDSCNQWNTATKYIHKNNMDATIATGGRQPEQGSWDTVGHNILTVKGNGSKSFSETPSSKSTTTELHRWMVVLGCFMCNVIAGGIDRCDGIFYLKFLEIYKGSAVASSWAVSLSGTLGFVLGPVSSALSERFSARSVVITGGFLLFISFLATGFSPSLLYIYITFGLIGGLGRSFIYTPGLIVVGQHFAEKPGLAVGAATSGMGAGTFALPPLVNFLFEEYQYWEVLTCLGLICLNAVAFGSLLRPQDRSEGKCYRNCRLRSKGNKMKDRKENPVQLMYINHGFHSVETPGHVCSRTRDDATGSRPEVDGSCDLDDVSIIDIDAPTMQNVQQKNGVNGKTASDTDTDKNVSSTSSKFFDFSLLRYPCFVMFCVSILLFTSAFRAAIAFLPALAESLGCTNTEAALLISVSGVFDMIGRILCGYFFDLKSIRNIRTFTYSVILLLTSCTTSVCPFMFGFPQFAPIFGIYGLLTGAYASQKSVVLVDILGVEKLSSSFGFLLLCQGLGSLIGVPLSGFLMDTLGNYGYVFYLGGGMMAVASVVMVISNILLVSQRSRSRRGLSEVVIAPSGKANIEQ